MNPARQIRCAPLASHGEGDFAGRHRECDVGHALEDIARTGRRLGMPTG